MSLLGNLIVICESYNESRLSSLKDFGYLKIYCSAGVRFVFSSIELSESFELSFSLFD
jgi:hypothetical protein